MKMIILIENCVAMGKYLDKKIEELKAKHPSIGDWRNTGLLGCLELVKNKDNQRTNGTFQCKAR